MKNLIKFLLPTLVYLQAHIIALAKSNPELFNDKSKHYLFREPDPFESIKHSVNYLSPQDINQQLLPQIKSFEEFKLLLSVVRDQEKLETIKKISTYGGFQKFIESTNSILKLSFATKLTWDLNSIFSRTNRPELTENINPVFQESLVHLNSILLNHQRDSKTESLASILAKNLTDEILWEVINTRTLNNLTTAVSNKIDPFIWKQLRKDIKNQIRYHVMMNKKNGSLEPDLISKDVIVGKYKIVRVYGLAKELDKSIRNQIEQTSSSFAVDKFLKIADMRIGEGDRVAMDINLEYRWTALPVTTKTKIKDEIVCLFNQTHTQDQLDFNYINLSWDAYHGNFRGDINCLIDYTHIASIWTGMIVYQTEQFSELQESLAKSIKESMNEEEIIDYVPNKLSLNTRESVSYAFPMLLSSTSKWYL